MLFVRATIAIEPWCLNSTLILPFQTSNFTIQEIGYTGVASSIFGTIDPILNTLTYDALYSLTSFPNSVLYNCPQPRYKGIASSSNREYLPSSTFATRFNLFLTNVSYYNFNIRTYLVKQNCIFKVGFNNTFKCYTLANPFLPSIPDNCNTIGISTITVSIASVLITDNITLDVSSSLPCDFKSYTCGTTIQPIYNSSCCYLNGTVYGTFTYLPLNSDNFDPVLGLCKPQASLSQWQIIVIVLAVLIVIVLGISVLSYYCKSKHNYIHH